MEPSASAPARRRRLPPPLTSDKPEPVAAAAAVLTSAEYSTQSPKEDSANHSRSHSQSHHAHPSPEQKVEVAQLNVRIEELQAEVKALDLKCQELEQQKAELQVRRASCWCQARRSLGDAVSITGCIKAEPLVCRRALTWSRRQPPNALPRKLPPAAGLSRRQRPESHSWRWVGTAMELTCRASPSTRECCQPQAVRRLPCWPPQADKEQLERQAQELTQAGTAAGNMQLQSELEAAHRTVAELQVRIVLPSGCARRPCRCGATPRRSRLVQAPARLRLCAGEER
jgi:hypothetical protein